MTHETVKGKSKHNLIFVYIRTHTLVILLVSDSLIWVKFSQICVNSKIETRNAGFATMKYTQIDMKGHEVTISDIICFAQ